jgi:hypothetical protein
MENKLRDHLRLMLSIKLTMLPRWVKHDFWRQCSRGNEQATKKRVDTIVTVIDETVDVVERRNSAAAM